MEEETGDYCEERKMTFMNTNEVEVSDKDMVKGAHMVVSYLKSL